MNCGETDVSSLIESAQNGDIQAKNKLVENNLGLVWSVVKKFQSRMHETEDLFQIGSIGLIKAIDKFNPAFCVQFSTYAVPMIMGEIKRFLRDDGMIKVSRSVKENGIKIKRAINEFQNKFDREPTINEIAAFMEMDAEDVVMSLDAITPCESLYSEIFDQEGSSTFLMDRIVSDTIEEDKIINRITVKELLKKLDKKERQIIILRYFKEMTQSQIADMLGISQVQVSRLEKRIIHSLKLKIL